VAPPLLNAQGSEPDQRTAESGDEDMTIRTQLTAAAIEWNHNEMLQVRSALKAGGLSATNHNETLHVKSALKAGGLTENHNEALQIRSALKAGVLRRRLETTAPREDRLSLLVVRAGLRAGARRGKPGIRK
jgi:hypothetical protein